MGDDETPASPSTPRWAWAAAGVLAAIPVARMTLLVLGAHRLPYNDYWPMLDSMLTADGGFDASGLFELRNEHPLVVAKVMYWLNLQVTGGSNVALGLVVVAIAVAQLAVVVVLARDLGPRWRLAPPLLLVAAAYLLFARQGAWHFVKSMSGSAWLTANLFSLLAIWAQVRGRWLLAIAMAALATLSYGTGLLAWPVLLVVGLLAGAPPKRLLPALGTGVVAFVWLQLQLADLGKSAGDRPPLLVWGARGAEVVGAYFFPRHRVTSIRTGEAIVAAGLVLAGLVVLRRLRAGVDARPAAPWVGLLAYGAGMGLLIAAGRNTILWTGTAPRYAAIGALTVLGVVGIALSLASERSWPGRVVALGAPVAVAVLAVGLSYTGAREVRELEHSEARQDLLAVALEQRLVGGSRLWLGNLERAADDGIEERLAAAGQDFGMVDSLDCGLLGETIERDEVDATLPAGVRAEVTRLDPAGQIVERGVLFDGWVEGADLECAVLVADDGRVVGASGHGSPAQGYGGPNAVDLPGRVWFSGLGPTGGEPTVVVRLDGHDQLFALPSPAAPG